MSLFENIYTLKKAYEEKPELLTWENSYPIFSENYRSFLNNLIINRYYYNNLGFLDVARFNFELSSILNIIMPYFNNLLLAYTELNKIGFDKLITDSIGTLTKNSTNFIGNIKGNFSNTTNTNDKLLFEHNENKMLHGKIDTITHDTISENEHIKDAKNLNLLANSPMSHIDDNLNSENWNNQPFVSSAEKSTSNQGTIKTTNSGNDINKTTGTDTSISQRSNENVGENITIGNNENKSNNNTLFNSDVKNYDYMETFKKILEILKNINEEILENLRFLFLYTYD